MKKRVLRWLSLLLASLTVALTLISCEGSVGSVTQLSFVNSTSFVIEELILYKSDNSESVILKTTTIDAGGTLDYKIRWSEDYLTSKAEIYVAASSEENGTRYIRKTVDCFKYDNGTILETVTFLYDEANDSFYVELSYSGEIPTTEAES